MKKTTRIFPLVLSVLLLLVIVTASARARRNPNPAAPVPGEIHGEIRWKKEMGLIPIGPGSAQASTSACSAFFIVAVAPGGDKIIGYSPPSTSQPKEREEYYVCDYYMQVPLNTTVWVFGGFGDVALLPKMNPELYYGGSNPWIGGTNSRPPLGSRRGIRGYGFTNGLSGSLSHFVRFEMIYVPSDIPYVAGAWRAKFGDRFMELILQQNGSKVTGELRGFSYPVFIREGILLGNTLRFSIMRFVDRFGKVSGKPEVLGSGELVMDEGGKSFTGTILGTATSGTLVGR